MDYLDLLDEFEKEYPTLFDAYQELMAGGIDEAWIRDSYEHHESSRAMIDEAKTKYIEILQEMGLFI